MLINPVTAPQENIRDVSEYLHQTAGNRLDEFTILQLLSIADCSK